MVPTMNLIMMSVQFDTKYKSFTNCINKQIHIHWRVQDHWEGGGGQECLLKAEGLN